MFSKLFNRSTEKSEHKNKSAIWFPDKNSPTLMCPICKDIVNVQHTTHKYEICKRCDKNNDERMKKYYMDMVSNINERFPKSPALVWAPPPPAPAPYQMFPGIFLGKKPENCPLTQKKNRILSKCVDCMSQQWIQNPYPDSPINKDGNGRMEYIHCIECIESLEQFGDSRTIETYRVNCMMLNLEESNLYD